MAGRKESGTEFPMPIKAVPYHHQMEAFRFACGLFGILPGAGKESGSRDTPPRQPGAGCALLMEMGTGKTLTTIGITGALSNAGRIRRVLVVAPLSILGVWEEEFRKFADFPYCLVVLSGNGSRKRDTLRHMAGASLQVAVVNYESAWRMEKDLGAWRPDLIVADEGHKIKTHNISASRAMHRLGAKAGYRVLLTGTVITNKAVDVFSQGRYGRGIVPFKEVGDCGIGKAGFFAEPVVCPAPLGHEFLYMLLDIHFHHLPISICIYFSFQMGDIIVIISRVDIAQKGYSHSMGFLWICYQGS